MKSILKNVLLTSLLATGTLGTTWLTLPTKPAAAIVLPAQRIQFAPGSDGKYLRGYLQPDALNSYVFKAMAGQEGSISVRSLTGQMLTLSVFGVDGTRLTNSGQNWIGQLPASEDYFIRVVNDTGVPTPYTLNLTVLPLHRTHTPFVNF
ncbi:hypothetical protein H6G93_38505 [Nostoc sp. FACHB-973]|nr:hypothetical protein [Nostoc sp. FACHB-973]